MKLRMLQYGMLAGFGFLMVVAVLEWLAGRPGGAHINTGGGLEGDVSAQMWLVLAEARKILEGTA